MPKTFCQSFWCTFSFKNLAESENKTKMNQFLKRIILAKTHVCYYWAVMLLACSAVCWTAASPHKFPSSPAWDATTDTWTAGQTLARLSKSSNIQFSRIWKKNKKIGNVAGGQKPMPESEKQRNDKGRICICSILSTRALKINGV